MAKISVLMVGSNPSWRWQEVLAYCVGAINRVTNEEWTDETITLRKWHPVTWAIIFAATVISYFETLLGSQTVGDDHLLTSFHEAHNTFLFYYAHVR